MKVASNHARRNGGSNPPVCSPWHMLVATDGSAIRSSHELSAAAVMNKPAAETLDIRAMQLAGHPIVTWTVNDKPRMLQLMSLGVNGIISDRPDLLFQAAAAFGSEGDATPIGFFDADGLIDISKFDAQGHRGGRDLRPENTFPAMEVALDSLMTTLETDIGLSADGVPMLAHDPYVVSGMCRKVDGGSYSKVDEFLIRDLNAADLQSRFTCDGLIRGFTQDNKPGLSPVSVAFAAKESLAHPYVMPALHQLFDFVAFYRDYYRSGAGAARRDATKRWKNADRVRFNIETKIDPRQDPDDKGNIFAERTYSPQAFVTALAGAITRYGLEDRADIQSFDFRSLLLAQEQFPSIRTVYLFGDDSNFDFATIMA